MTLFKIPVKKLCKISVLAQSLIMASTLTSSWVNAESLAITNATVYTVTEQGVLSNATILVENGKITAINPDVVNADRIIDAQGKILTPGLIASMNQLGLVEVDAVARTQDAEDEKADIIFDASLAFNPKSSLIPYSRKGGITRSVVTPSGGKSIFKGQAFVVDLSASFDSVLQKNTAVVIDLGAKREGSRALGLQELFNTLEDREKEIIKLTKAAKATSKTKSDDKDKDKDEPKRDEIIINALLAGKEPLLAYADRATDILELIRIKQRFKLTLIIVGAADAALVTKELVAADVTVIIDAMQNLPDSFDSLHHSLSSADMLTAAGVKVILSASNAHNMYQLRYDAGNAIANGLSKEAALAAVTANVADTFNINAGRIAVGYAADLVLWSADPFELSSKVDKIWIGGEEVSTISRQDALRQRYMTKSDMPHAYTK